ncbi:MAG: hypothetical protein OXO56_07960 [Gammaproteobacteria bacterium]|nr:hypothetical protein [Gammaproteobacteria bacterium]
MRGCLTAIVILFGVGLCISAIPEPEPEEVVEAEPEPEPEDEPAEVENPLYLANLLCRQLVERSAAYSFRWTDSFLGGTRKFWQSGDFNPEGMEFLGDAVEFQTAGGAWARYRYVCTVVPSRGTARLDLIEPGQW